MDGLYQGEVKATSTCNRNGYQYYLTNLKPGRSYDINIRVSHFVGETCNLFVY